MRLNIKILTQNCCEDLLTFSARPELRKKYDKDTFDNSTLEYVKIPTKYFIEDDIELGEYSDESLPPFHSKVYHLFRAKVYQCLHT